MVTLVLSDVAPGDLLVASGPTLRDDTTTAEANAALGALPSAVRPRLVDTPAIEPATVVLLGDATSAARAAEAALAPLVETVVTLDTMDGPMDEVVGWHLAALERALDVAGSTAAVVSTGEATLDVRGDGRGGRNTHFVLATLVASAFARRASSSSCPRERTGATATPTPRVRCSRAPRSRSRGAPVAIPRTRSGDSTAPAISTRSARSCARGRPGRTSATSACSSRVERDRSVARLSRRMARMSRSVLIVDDEEAARYGMRRALEREGYELDEAGSADEARRKVAVARRTSCSST